MMREEQVVDKRLILVDGSSYLYRAFHAYPPLSNRLGEPTGAIYGVLMMLSSLLKQYQPSHLAVVFDTKGKNQRHALYKEYKAHRPKMPEALQQQLEPLFQLIDVMGIARLVISGFEADDVLGTLACQAAEQGWQVVISSGDKDMAQLITSQITVVNTMHNVIHDRQQIQQRYGIEPALIVDLLALMGDSVDNIPGVPGIGEKTALALLQALGGLSDIYADLSRVHGLPIRGAKRVAERLALYQEQAELSYQLATIHTAVPLPITLVDLQRRPADFAQLCLLFSRYEFKHWLAAARSGQLLHEQSSSTLQTLKSEKKPEFPKTQIASLPGTLILDNTVLTAWISKLKASTSMAFYCDSHGRNPWQAQLYGVAIALEDGETAYLPLDSSLPESAQLGTLEQRLAALKALFEAAVPVKVGHHSKLQRQLLARYGITLQGLVSDTQLAAYLLDSTSGRNTLVQLAERYLSLTQNPEHEVGNEPASEPLSKQGGNPELSLSLRAKQALAQVGLILPLHQQLLLQLSPRQQQLLNELELPLLTVLAQMESNGVLVDISQLQRHSQRLGETLAELEEQVYTLAGERFNLASPKQLQAILFDKLQLPCLRKTPRGASSTDESVLNELAQRYPLPALLLQHRSLAKLKSTYLDTLPQLIQPATGRIHTTYHQTITSTGRLSSSDPNLQNIPIRSQEGRQIRQAFIAPPGYQLLSADYSQIELRIMAHLSGDPMLLQAFRKDQDVHCATAAELFHQPLEAVTSEQRREAKTINFGLIYGMSAFGLARQLGVDYRQAQAILVRYFERYPGILHYMQNIRQQALEQGYVETLFGRRLYLPEIQSKQIVRRQAAERAAVNAPVQGTGADIIKRAMIAIAAWIHTLAPDTVRMVLQVHDELVFEVNESALPVAAENIRRLMGQSTELLVPLKVDIGVGSHWDLAH